MRLLWWTLAVLSLSLFSILLSENRTLDPLQNLSLTIAAPMENGLRDIADPVSGFFQGIFSRGDLVRENERLREELERLQAGAAIVRERFCSGSRVRFSERRMLNRLTLTTASVHQSNRIVQWPPHYPTPQRLRRAWASSAAPFAYLASLAPSLGLPPLPTPLRRRGPRR